MKRSEGATGFAVLAGAMFLVSVMGPVFVYAFRPAAHDPMMLAGFAVTGLGLSAALYGVSTILSSLPPAPPAALPAPADSPSAAGARADLMGGPAGEGAKAFKSPKELMSSVKTLIELENWKLAHQRAFELIEAYPESEEAARVKQNIDYLQKKAAG